MITAILTVVTISCSWKLLANELSINIAETMLNRVISAEYNEFDGRCLDYFST